MSRGRDRKLAKHYATPEIYGRAKDRRRAWDGIEESPTFDEALTVEKAERFVAVNLICSGCNKKLLQLKRRNTLGHSTEMTYRPPKQTPEPYTGGHAPRVAFTVDSHGGSLLHVWCGTNDCKSAKGNQREYQLRVSLWEQKLDQLAAVAGLGNRKVIDHRL